MVYLDSKMSVSVLALVPRARPAPGSGSPLPVFDRGTTKSSAFRGSAGVAALFSICSSRRLSLLVFLHLLVPLHLLCLPGGGVVRGLEVHEHTNSGTKTTRIAAWEMNNEVPDSPTFTGTKEDDETPAAPATSPARRRLRQENKHYNSNQYLVLEANGAGETGGGEGLTSKRITRPAHADRGWRQEPETTDDEDGESERDTSRDLRKPPHLQQPIGGSHSHFEQQRRSSYASAATGGDAARRESRSGSSGAAAQHITSGPLTVDAATASSEFGGTDSRGPLVAGNLIDGDLTTLAHTSDALPEANNTNGVGQKCPWWQLDLGATKTVDKVKLSAETRPARMRRLLFVLPMNAGNRVSGGGSEMTGERAGGVRVLVGNSARNRADTSEHVTGGRWSGNDVGSICPEPLTGEECETIQCDDPATCLDRFAEESTDTHDIGTAEVDCNGKQGRYVTIELPGVTASETNQIRTSGLTEVRVEGGPAQTESPTPASTAVVIGGDVVLALVLAAVGVWFALDNSQAGRSRPVDAAVEDY